MELTKKYELLLKPFITNQEAIELLEISKNSYYKYKKKLDREIGVPNSKVRTDEILRVVGVDKNTFRRDLERALKVLGGNE